jgi:hypothetical protein
MKGDEVKSFTLVLDEANTITFCRDAGEHIKLHRQALIKKPNPLFIDWLVLTIDSSSEPDMPTQWAIPVLFHPTSDGMACMLNKEPVVFTRSAEIPDFQTIVAEMNTRNEELQLPMPFPLHKAIHTKAVAKNQELREALSNFLIKPLPPRGEPWRIRTFAQLLDVDPRAITKHAAQFAQKRPHLKLKEAPQRKSQAKNKKYAGQNLGRWIFREDNGDAEAFWKYLQDVMTHSPEVRKIKQNSD